MGAEIGATCSMFPYDDRAAMYLKATRREESPTSPTSTPSTCGSIPRSSADPERFYDRVVEIDLDELEPHLVGPHTPDLDRPVCEVAAEAEEGYPLDISAALVGSCTNSSYEDIGRAAHVARQAKAAGLTVKSPLLITPGSEQVRATIERDGLLDDLEAIGATVLANACGPCIGQWKRDDIEMGETNTIVSSFNRNFPRPQRRQHGDARVHRVAGDVVGDGAHRPARPSTSCATVSNGRREYASSRPSPDELPAKGFDPGDAGFQPRRRPRDVDVVVQPDSSGSSCSSRSRRGTARTSAACGAAQGGRASARPTTSRRRARGSASAATSRTSPEPVHRRRQRLRARRPGEGVDVRDGSTEPLPDLAKAYKEAGIYWVAVGDENYGEGRRVSTRRWSRATWAGRAVIVRSFARIHEANLKKQGHDPLGVGVERPVLELDRRADADGHLRWVGTFSTLGRRLERGHTFSVPHRPIGMTGAFGQLRPAGPRPSAP